MSTDIDDYGNYPLAEDLEIYFDAPPFEEMWKTSFQFHPLIPIDWKKAEPFKDFAKKLYNQIVSDSSNTTRLVIIMQDVANEAYKDGKEDGYTAGKEDGKDEGYNDAVSESIEKLKDLKR
jgi:hypothetical protein